MWIVISLFLNRYKWILMALTASLIFLGGMRAQVVIQHAREAAALNKAVDNLQDEVKAQSDGALRLPERMLN